MKIFQLIHWLTKLFKLNNRSKIILLILLPLPIFSQNNAAFWLGKRANVSDPYFSNVSLLLHMDGVNGSTTFTDDSNNNFTVTPYGNAQISTTESKFGGASGYFDGSGDYLSVSQDNDFNFGSGNFTWEAWVYVTSLSSTRGLYYYGSRNTNRMQLLIETTGYAQLYIEVSAGYFTLSSSAGTIQENTWHHIAFVRNGNNYNVFVDGIAGGTVTTTISPPSNLTPYIGLAQTAGTNRYFQGYMDDIRITKGVARYTSNFTPPTAPFPDN